MTVMGVTETFKNLNGSTLDLYYLSIFSPRGWINIKQETEWTSWKSSTAWGNWNLPVQYGPQWVVMISSLCVKRWQFPRTVVTGWLRLIFYWKFVTVIIHKYFILNSAEIVGQTKLWGLVKYTCIVVIWVISILLYSGKSIFAFYAYWESKLLSSPFS